MMGSTGRRNFTALLLLAAAIVVVFNSPTDAVGISATTLETASRKIVNEYYGKDVKGYGLLVYLTQAELKDPNLDLEKLCKDPKYGQVINFPADTPLDPTYKEIWEMIEKNSNYITSTYDSAKKETYSAFWSDKCFSSRFKLKKKTFVPHYEQLLAVWMLNNLRNLNTGEVLTVFGSKKPCDYGEQADGTMRYCSDILRDVFHMRKNKLKQDLAKSTLYVNSLSVASPDHLLVFDWATENTITLRFPNQHIDTLVADYITGMYSLESECAVSSNLEQFVTVTQM